MLFDEITHTQSKNKMSLTRTSDQFSLIKQINQKP